MRMFLQVVCPSYLLCKFYYLRKPGSTDTLEGFGTSLIHMTLTLLIDGCSECSPSFEIV